MISGPLIKNAPVLFATARAISVLPKITVNLVQYSQHTGSRSSKKKNTVWSLDSHRFEKSWVTKREFHDFANLHHLLSATANIVVSDLKRVKNRIYESFYLVEGLLDVFLSDWIAIAVDHCIWRDYTVRFRVAVDDL